MSSQSGLGTTWEERASKPGGCFKLAAQYAHSSTVMGMMMRYSLQSMTSSRRHRRTTGTRPETEFACPGRDFRERSRDGAYATGAINLEHGGVKHHCSARGSPSHALGSVARIGRTALGLPRWRTCRTGESWVTSRTNPTAVRCFGGKNFCPCRKFRGKRLN
jgi:hypothetical protein